MLRLVEDVEEVVYSSLEEYLSRDKVEVCTDMDKMKAIFDMKERIKYYLDEIELYLPRRRKWKNVS